MDEGTRQALDSMERRRKLEREESLKAELIASLEANADEQDRSRQAEQRVYRSTMEAGAAALEDLEKPIDITKAPTYEGIAGSNDLKALETPSEVPSGDETLMSDRYRREAAADLTAANLTDPAAIIRDFLTRGNDVRDWPADERNLHRNWTGDFTSRHAAVIDLRTSKILALTAEACPWDCDHCRDV